MTHYETLRVPLDASQEYIQDSYNELMKNNHQLLIQSPDAKQTIKIINEAYAVLSDPVQRSKYDELFNVDTACAEINAAVANYVRKNKKVDTKVRIIENSHTPNTTSTTPINSTPSPFLNNNRAKGSNFSYNWTLIGPAAIFLLGVGFFSLSNDLVVEFRDLFVGQTRPNVEAADKESLSLLQIICRDQKITDLKCKSVIDYPITQPNGQACDLTLTGQSIEGHFLTGRSSQILAGYHSNCEPHASNFGGSVLFEKVDGSLLFKGYKQGEIFTECTSISNGNDQDKLFCSAGSMFQGYIETGIFEVLLRRSIDGAIEIDTINLISAVDSFGALGANLVKCNKDLNLVSIGSAKAGKSVGTIIFEGEYVDNAAVRKACALNADPPKELVEGTVPAKSGEAFVAEADIKKDAFVLNIVTQQVQILNSQQ